MKTRGSKRIKSVWCLALWLDGVPAFLSHGLLTYGNKETDEQCPQ
jgi:hypothetical protein